MVDFTALLTLAPEADRDAVASKLGTATLLQPTLPGTFEGGDLIAHFRDTHGVGDLLANPAVVHVDSAVYEPIGAGAAEPDLTGGIYRVLLLAVDPLAPEAAIHQLEADLLAMPRYINSIRNWRLSRVTKATGARAWTHVWEQEYADLGGLLGPYMTHPYHWARVDRWFDPECPEHIVDMRLCHSFCALPRSIL